MLHYWAYEILSVSSGFGWRWSEFNATEKPSAAAWQEALVRRQPTKPCRQTRGRRPRNSDLSSTLKPTSPMRRPFSSATSPSRLFISTRAPNHGRVSQLDPPRVRGNRRRVGAVVRRRGSIPARAEPYSFAQRPLRNAGQVVRNYLYFGIAQRIEDVQSYLVWMRISIPISGRPTPEPL